MTQKKTSNNFHNIGVFFLQQSIIWRHDTQYNDTQINDTRRNENEHNDTHGKIYSAMWAFLLQIHYKLQYEQRYFFTECCEAEFSYADCHYAEYLSAECRYTKCRYAECRGAHHLSILGFFVLNCIQLIDQKKLKYIFLFLYIVQGALTEGDGSVRMTSLLRYLVL